MSEIRWGAYDDVVTYLTTELNSMAKDALVVGAAIDFAASGVDRKQYMDIEIVTAQIDLSTGDNPCLKIWLLRRTDGTNFEDGSASVEPARAPNKIVALRKVNAAQRVTAAMLLTTPDQGKLLIKYEPGVAVALASSGNTLKYRIYGDEIV